MNANKYRNAKNDIKSTEGSDLEELVKLTPVSYRRESKNSYHSNSGKVHRIPETSGSNIEIKKSSKRVVEKSKNIHMNKTRNKTHKKVCEAIEKLG